MKSDLIIARGEDPDMQVDELTKALDTLKSEITKTQVEINRPGEDCEK